MAAPIRSRQTPFSSRVDSGRDMSRPLPAVLSWSVLCFFVGALAIATVALELPHWIPAAYGALSLVTVAAYGLDKRAARRGRRRTSEQSLLTMGLLGGWPGALVAQQSFRHKTRKRSFRRAFWETVVVNVAALVTLVVLATTQGWTLDSLFATWEIYS